MYQILPKQPLNDYLLPQSNLPIMTMVRDIYLLILSLITSCVFVPPLYPKHSDLKHNVGTLKILVNLLRFRLPGAAVLDIFHGKRKSVLCLTFLLHIDPADFWHILFPPHQNRHKISTPKKWSCMPFYFGQKQKLSAPLTLVHCLQDCSILLIHFTQNESSDYFG